MKNKGFEYGFKITSETELDTTDQKILQDIMFHAALYLKERKQNLENAKKMNEISNNELLFSEIERTMFFLRFRGESYSNNLIQYLKEKEKKKNENNI